MIRIDYLSKISDNERALVENVARNVFTDDSKHYIIELEFVSRKHVTNLNKKYRHKNSVTDVLSFPQIEIPGQKNLLGTIVICPEYAALLGESLSELFHHGLLHLMGYDHETKPKDWSKIYHKTKRLLK